MPKIIPITDLRNTTKISELCHEKNEPVFITKNGYSDLVIMSAEAYEELTEGPKAARTAERPEEMCYLTEQSPVWAGMLADVLQQHGVPFFKESSLGPGWPSRRAACRSAYASLFPNPAWRTRKIW